MVRGKCSPISDSPGGNNHLCLQIGNGFDALGCDRHGTFAMIWMCITWWVPPPQMFKLLSWPFNMGRRKKNYYLPFCAFAPSFKRSSTCHARARAQHSGQRGRLNILRGHVANSKKNVICQTVFLPSAPEVSKAS